MSSNGYDDDNWTRKNIYKVPLIKQAQDKVSQVSFKSDRQFKPSYRHSLIKKKKLKLWICELEIVKLAKLVWLCAYSFILFILVNCKWINSMFWSTKAIHAYKKYFKPLFFYKTS